MWIKCPFCWLEGVNIPCHIWRLSQPAPGQVSPLHPARSQTLEEGKREGEDERVSAGFWAQWAANKQESHSLCSYVVFWLLHKFKRRIKCVIPRSWWQHSTRKYKEAIHYGDGFLCLILFQDNTKTNSFTKVKGKITNLTVDQKKSSI